MDTYQMNRSDSSQPRIRTNITIRLPIEMLLEVPNTDNKKDGTNSHNKRHGRQHAANVFPDRFVQVNQALTVCISRAFEGLDALSDLLALVNSQRQKTRIEQTRKHSLGRALETNGIGHENQLEHEPENKNGQVGWYNVPSRDLQHSWFEIFIPIVDN